MKVAMLTDIEGCTVQAGQCRGLPVLSQQVSTKECHCRCNLRFTTSIRMIRRSCRRFGRAVLCCPGRIASAWSPDLRSMRLRTIDSVAHLRFSQSCCATETMTNCCAGHVVELILNRKVHGVPSLWLRSRLPNCILPLERRTLVQDNMMTGYKTSFSGHPNITTRILALNEAAFRCFPGSCFHVSVETGGLQVARVVHAEDGRTQPDLPSLRHFTNSAPRHRGHLRRFWLPTKKEPALMIWMLRTRWPASADSKLSEFEARYVEIPAT